MKKKIYRSKSFCEKPIADVDLYTLLALITPSIIGINFGLLALLGPVQKGPRF